MENSNTIKNWAIDERPREKLLTKGKAALTDAELLTILIGSGVTGSSALDIARKILASVNNNLIELCRLSVADLCKFEGIGPAKAINIIAAIELGRRRALSEALKKTKVLSSKDAYDYFHPLLSDLITEEFHVLYLNRSNEIIRSERISTGGINGTLIDLRIIFRYAFEHLATALILCHNHPSGNLLPSREDEHITKKIIDAAKIMDIAVLDHIIIAKNKYFSFADNGKLE